jgi:uncharacterized membrane protein
MQNSGLPKLVYGLLAAVGLVYFSSLYSQLPALMASHFNASGVPTAWMPKSAFFIFFPFVMLIASVPVFLVPKLIANKPNDKINLPNKEYWLAPERRTETIEFVGTQMAWFGCALLALLLFGFYFAIAANLRPDHTFDSGSFYLVLGAFFAFIIFFLLRMFTHFGRTPSTWTSK